MVSVSKREQKQREKAEGASGYTGIPGAVQAKFEADSGLSFGDVRIHYNSPGPAQLGAYAYTRGNQVYIGPGQERYLEHELGHVVQQKRGLVKPDGTIGGFPVNRDPALERAADEGADQPARGLRMFGGEAVQMMGPGWGNKAWEEEEWEEEEEETWEEEEEEAWEEEEEEAWEEEEEEAWQPEEEEEEEDVWEEDKPLQIHHYATNKSRVYTQQFQAIVSKYGLNLDGGWNKEELPHQGRHPDEYHAFVLEQMQAIDHAAQGDVRKFLSLFERNVKKVVRNNPGMLYSEYWQ